MLIEQNIIHCIFTELKKLVTTICTAHSFIVFHFFHCCLFFTQTSNVCFIGTVKLRHFPYLCSFFFSKINNIIFLSLYVICFLLQIQEATNSIWNNCTVWGKCATTLHLWNQLLPQVHSIFIHSYCSFGDIPLVLKTHSFPEVQSSCLSTPHEVTYALSNIFSVQRNERNIKINGERIKFKGKTCIKNI